MLLGRTHELERLDSLTRRAFEGSPECLLVVGDPGMGKTALLDVGARRAARRGARVLRVRAAEGADDQPFAVADDVHVAAGQRPPTASGVTCRVEALRELLASGQDAAPLVLLVDDAHNADQESLHAVRQALGRMADQPVAALVASRPERAVEDVFASWPRLDLGPLSVEAGTALLRSVIGVEADHGVLSALASALQGVPLALREAARILTPEQLAGREPLPEPLPLACALTSAWGAVLDRLPERTRLALVDLSVAGPRPDLLAALAEEAGWRPDDLDPAVAAGLVSIDTRPPSFRHPLVREVVLRSAPAAVLRARHAVAADRARALSLPPAVVVGHLTRTVVMADAQASAAIADEAERAERLGHLDAACRAWAAAARTSVTTEDRMDRALRGVRLVARFDLGVGEVGRLIDLLSGVTLDAEAAGWVSWLRAVQRADIDPHASLTAQWAAIDEARLSSPAVLPVLLWDAAMSAWTLGRPEDGLRAAREVLELQRHGGSGSGRASPPWTGLALMAAAHLQRGDIAEGTALRGQALAQADAADPAAMELGVLLDAVFLDDLLLDTGAGGAERLAVAERRFRDSPEPMACLWGIEAWRARATGRWTSARALLERARPLADNAGATGAARGISALAVELASACADVETLHAEAEALQSLTDRWCDRRRRATLDRALGLRRLLDGRLDDAVTHLTSAADVPFAGRGLRDGVLPARVDLVEAYARRDDRDAALHWRARVRDLLVAFDDPLGAALAWRTDALVAPDVATADEAFRAALEAHAGSPEGFEQARSHLLFGEHLRRTQRRREARAVIADAVVLLDRLGAQPWLRRAIDELRACGVAPVTPGPPDELTPQERVVAEAVAQGRSNREAADLLSLSPRTVEHHLSNCYRKLGVRGRSGLARSMLAQQRRSQMPPVG